MTSEFNEESASGVPGTVEFKESSYWRILGEYGTLLQSLVESKRVVIWRFGEQRN
jgi:hypothetical protein